MDSTHRNGRLWQPIAPPKRLAETSIVHAPPKAPLVPLLPFLVNFHKLVQDQEEQDPYHEYFEDRDQEEEVAARCDPWDDSQEVNQMFDDPTLFKLLSEWQEERINLWSTVDTEGKVALRASKEQEKLEGLRPTWSSVFGQVEEENEYGDQSDLHLKEWPRPPHLGDNNLRRMLSEPVRGKKRVPYAGQDRRFRHYRWKENEESNESTAQPPSPGNVEQEGSIAERSVDLEAGSSDAGGTLAAPMDGIETNASEGKQQSVESSSAAMDIDGNGAKVETCTTESDGTLTEAATVLETTAPSSSPAAAVPIGIEAEPSSTQEPASELPLTTMAKENVITNATGDEATSSEATESTAMEVTTTEPTTPSHPPKETAPTATGTASPETVEPESPTAIRERNARDKENLELVLATEKRPDPQIPKTKLENKFQEFSMRIEDSSLKTFQIHSRFTVPTKRRLPINYKDVNPGRLSKVYTPVLDRETILSVALYKRNRPTVKAHEFLFLGSQPLSALRDAFFCLSDFLTHSMHEPGEGAPRIRNTDKKKTSNSFFFMEGTFFTDSPLLRAKLEQREALQEKERRRLQDLRDRCRRRYEEAVEDRKQRQAVARLLRKSKRRKVLDAEDAGRKEGEVEGTWTGEKQSVEGGGENQAGEDENENEDAEEEELVYDDSDLLAQMQIQYKEEPLEDIRVVDEEQLARASQDYSQVILDWINKSPKRKTMPRFQNIQQRPMHDTLLQSLSLRINHPYLFVHQGDCEHILMIQDIRLFSQQHDPLNRNDYPVETFRGQTVRHQCKMCNLQQARYITVEDRLSGESPCYFCEQCYHAFHYDTEGNILYDDFKVFAYENPK